MTVESTLQDMFDHYPTLFATRGQCYDHLFCTNGNGYDWINGQLISTEYQGKDFKSMHEDDYKREYIPTAHQSKKNFKMKYEMDMRILMYELKGNKKKADEYASGKKIQWYPLCKYANIFNIPRNIKDDWKRAAIECFRMLEDDGVIDKAQKEYGELIYKTVRALGIKPDYC